MALIAPMSVPDFVCCTELGVLLQACQSVNGHPDSSEHLGSVIMQHEKVAEHWPQAGAAIQRIGKLLCGSKWAIEHCDLVYRAPGTPMDWHTDNAKFPTRKRTAICALNTIQGGESCVRYNGEEKVYPHEAGRLLFIDAALEHSCRASDQDRYALIYWLCAV